MNSMVMAWLAVRALRWLAYLGFLAYSLHYVLNPASHTNSFGHLLPTSEFAMFGLALLAVFAGFIELMMRERANLDRPKLGQLIPRELPPDEALRR